MLLETHSRTHSRKHTRTQTRTQTRKHARQKTPKAKAVSTSHETAPQIAPPTLLEDRQTSLLWRRKIAAAHSRRSSGVGRCPRARRRVPRAPERRTRRVVVPTGSTDSRQPSLRPRYTRVPTYRLSGESCAASVCRHTCAYSFSGLGGRADGGGRPGQGLRLSRLERADRPCHCIFRWRRIRCAR